MKPLKVILSGGGTGGHIYPAVSIANEIKRLRPDTEFLFVGAEGKMEMEKVPAAGYSIVGLWISGLQREFTVDNLSFPFKVISSLWKAKKIINEFKPDVVIGTGGFASGPTLRMAAAKKIPCLIQEQNSYPGITNKILASNVQAICVAYEGMEKYFPADKITLTGNPIRQDIQEVESKRGEAFDYFKLDPTKKTILVIGGSLGARTLNMAISAGLIRFIDEDIQLIWQTGKGYISFAKKDLAVHNSNLIFASDFITRMDLAYAAADVIISRAGASSISELCVVGKPCVFVPSPNVAEDHQTKNAMALVSKQAAVLVRDSEAFKNMVDKAFEIIKHDQLASQLSTNIKKLAYPNAANTIALKVLDLVKK